MKMSPVPQVAIYVVTQEKRGSERRRWLGFGWHGAAVLLVRSGTACRAPTEETAKAKRTMSGCEPSIGAWCGVTLAQAGMPVLLKGVRRSETRRAMISGLLRGACWLPWCETLSRMSRNPCACLRIQATDHRTRCGRDRGQPKVQQTGYRNGE
jgi:hypothetical protein